MDLALRISLQSTHLTGRRVSPCQQVIWCVSGGFDDKCSSWALVPFSSSSSTRHPQHSDGDDVHGQLEELEQTDDGAADPQAQDAADVRREVDGLRV